MASENRNMFSLRWGTALIFVAASLAGTPEPEAVAATPLTGLTAEELAAEPPAYQEEDPEVQPAIPADAVEAGDVRLEVLSEGGYRDERGRYVFDMLERDYAYLAVEIRTERADRSRELRRLSPSKGPASCWSRRRSRRDPARTRAESLNSRWSVGRWASMRSRWNSAG